MTTNRLRRELAGLRKRGGHGGCPGCGYPSLKNVEVVTRVRGIDDPEPPPIPPCSVCGRPPLTIKMLGLNEKAKGS